MVLMFHSKGYSQSEIARKLTVNQSNPQRSGRNKEEYKKLPGPLCERRNS